MMKNIHFLTYYRYGTKFMDEYQAIMTKKLGLPKYNKHLIGKLLNNMAVDKVDYTNFFRTLANVKADPNIPEDELLVPLKAVLLDIGKERKEAWISWVRSYIHEVKCFCPSLEISMFLELIKKKIAIELGISFPYPFIFSCPQLSSSGVSDEERKALMNSANPKYVLRNYLCQSAIDAAEQGDFGEVRRLLKLVERPYEEQPGMEKYARLPPAWAYRPGVCMLSCSS